MLNLLKKKEPDEAIKCRHCGNDWWITVTKYYNDKSGAVKEQAHMCASCGNIQVGRQEDRDD